jgi:hypothetical protein
MSRSTHEVDLPAAHHLDGLTPVGRVDDVVRVFEDEAKRLAEAGVVVDDQDHRADPHRGLGG